MLAGLIIFVLVFIFWGVRMVHDSPPVKKPLERVKKSVLVPEE